MLIKDHKRYGPVGRCIYCGASEQDGLLSREHIIPSALNGNLILPDASCEACRGITHAYEGHCAHEIYGPARARMGFQSRNKAKKPTTYSFEVGSGAAAQILEVPVNEMPVWLLSLAFDPPGILVRARPSEEHQGGIVVMRDVYPHDTARLREKGEGTVGRKFHIDSSKLIQMLAKIAHSFSVAEFGLNAFDPFLIDIVLGRCPNFPHYYVGGEFFVSPDSIHLHELSWRIYDTPLIGLIVVRIRLFARWGMPTYWVVAGQLYQRALREVEGRLERDEL